MQLILLPEQIAHPNGLSVSSNRKASILLFRECAIIPGNPHLLNAEPGIHLIEVPCHSKQLARVSNTAMRPERYNCGATKRKDPSRRRTSSSFQAERLNFHEPPKAITGRISSSIVTSRFPKI